MQLVDADLLVDVRVALLFAAVRDRARDAAISMTSMKDLSTSLAMQVI